MSNASLKAVMPLMFLASCVTTHPTHYWCTPNSMVAVSIEEALQQNPLATNQEIRITNLGIAHDVSHHLVQVRTRESPHFHKDHDLTVFIYRGHGKIMVGSNNFPLHNGDSLFIPRGVVHAFRNEGSIPAVAIAVFTPGFDGKDTIPSAEVK